jgi:hypothetical protein
LAAWAFSSGANCDAAVIFRDGPESGRQFAFKMLSDLWQADTNAFKGAQLRDLRITNSMPMYSVGQNDIFSGKLLSAAQLVGWDYLVMRGSKLIAVIPLNVDPTNREIIESGGIAMDDNQTIKALNSARGLARRQDYELRYLVEESSFRMVWLHGKTNDLIIPMEPTYGRMTPYRPYSEAQMIGFLFDPNDIAFSIEVPSNYVTNSSPTLTVDVTRGKPAHYCVMVDSTKLPTVPWSHYTSSNIIANLGTNEGWHEIRVGMIGPAAEPRITWVSKELKLDTTPPTLTITNPPGSLVVQPLIQIQGYSSEDLRRITYDISNASGMRTNEDVSISDRIMALEHVEFTTNYFQAYEVPLALGTNTITLHATDNAGNATNVVLNYTYDYSGKTNPVVTFYWPQDGAQISGSFTCQGHVDDFTAEVTVSLSGNAQIFRGIVERNGDFWIEHLPAIEGTNSLTVMVTDVAGHVVTKSIAVFKSSVRITIDPVTDNLWQPYVSVTGSIDTNGYTVWVNGVQATMSGTNWTATNVPTTPGGTAVFRARAIRNAENDGSKSAGSDDLFRVVVAEQTGQYAAVSGDGHVIALKDKTGNPIWENDIIAKYGTKLPMHSDGKIRSLELIKDQIVIYVGNEFICIEPKSGKIIREGAR